MYSSVVKIIHVRHFLLIQLINFVVLLISFTAELLNYHVFIGKCSSKYFSLHILISYFYFISIFVAQCYIVIFYFSGKCEPRIWNCSVRWKR